MPRPKKCRRVCGLPQCASFAPTAQSPSPDSEPIVMTVDEYETIRLIDIQRLTQEECSKQMGIARTTVTGIYDRARYKLAMLLVHGRKLVIAGGDITLCEHGDDCCGTSCASCCHREAKR